MLLGLIFALGPVSSATTWRSRTKSLSLISGCSTVGNSRGQRQDLFEHQRNRGPSSKPVAALLIPPLASTCQSKAPAGSCSLPLNTHVFQEMGHAVLWAAQPHCRRRTRTEDGPRVNRAQPWQAQAAKPLLSAVVWGAVAKPCGLIQRIKAADLLTAPSPASGPRHSGCWAAPLAAARALFTPGPGRFGPQGCLAAADGSCNPWRCLPAWPRSVVSSKGIAMAIDNELLLLPWAAQDAPGNGPGGGSIGILHCVLFPDPRYNLPLFGAIGGWPCWCFSSDR